MTHRAAVFLALLLMIGARPVAQQTTDQRTRWNLPFAPFHLIGNIQFVGTAGVSAFLIVTPEGSILLDGGLPETALQIAANITTLGFRVRDVKFLLNSHAHFDHAGGLAELKRMTGASLIASSGDAPTLKAGGGPDMPPLDVDRIVNDGETVRLGDATLTAHVTPGHTKGCTTWTMTTTDGGRAYRVVFYCSTSVVDRLVGNARYPQIVADYERTFKALRAIPSDVFLGPHPEFFAMAEKRKRMTAGGPNPFIDPAEMGKYVDSSERQFRAALAKEQSQK
ncbi:MAG TPA: subclass B3 metallo-beta-lactamase [Vicinamibacterales bacterium]|nr:subclass B3 metallo-beta-lactamase [Vicinamibacterales bacterium]